MYFIPHKSFSIQSYMLEISIHAAQTKYSRIYVGDVLLSMYCGLVVKELGPISERRLSEN